MLSSAEDHYRQQQALALVMLRRARKAWSQIDGAAITSSWNTLADDLLAVMTAVQVQAATNAAAYVGAAIAEQGADAPIVDNRALVPSAFAGVTSGGRDLRGLLDEPRIKVLTEIKGGTRLSDALQVGRNSLDRIAVTQIQDAGRVAAGASIAARPRVTGYVRMLNPPSCSRCVVLAGKFYKYNQGFRRHPACDCRHTPVLSDSDVPSPVAPEAIDTGKYFNSLSAAEQDRVFTKAGAQAIRDGADVSQVVNVRRGMETAGGLSTTSIGTSRVALAGQRLRAVTGATNVVRMMPESIYQLAGKDRAAVLDLLYRNGFIL